MPCRQRQGCGTGPRVSVVIPAYNAEPYLAEAMNSVFSQTYGNLEVVVVNDGSSDGTGAVAQSFGSAVRYVEQENGGPARARSRGIEECTGEYVAFLDADDLWESTKLEEQVAFLQSHPEIALVYSQMVNFSQGERSDEPPYPPRVYRGWLFDRLLVENFIPLPSVLVRAEALRSVGGFDGSLMTAEDTNFYLRLSQRYQIAGMDRPLIRRRLHPANLSRRVDVEVGTLRNLDQLVAASPDRHPARYPAMREAYRVRGTALLLDYFHRSEFARAGEVLRKLRSVGALDLRLRFYGLLLRLPEGVLTAARGMKERVRNGCRMLLGRT